MQERPTTVPETAIWNASDNEWELAEVDGNGEKHGIVKWWRPDGTPSCTTEYVHGTAQGSYTRYHENGEVSRCGTFVDGSLHGTDQYNRSSAPTSENFPAGLGDHIRRAEMDYNMGSVKAARCYNASGAQCMEDGEPFPETRPVGVPADAHFRKREADGEYRWVLGTVVDNGDGTIDRVGMWRWWTPEGVLASEEPYATGKLDGVAREFDDGSGALIEEVTWKSGEREGTARTFEDGELTSETTYRDGKKRGPQLRRIDPDECEDGEVLSVRGEFDDDSPIGVIDYLDGSGAVLGSVDTGRDADLEVTQKVLAAEGGLLGLADGLLAEKQFGPGLLALARAIGRGETDASRLQSAVAKLTPPISETARGTKAHRARMVESNMQRFGAGPDKCLKYLFGAIRNGADAWALMQTSAATLDDMGETAIASEVIDAAIAAAPAAVSSGFEYTRALIRASQGDPAGAQRSVAALATTDADLASHLRPYFDALFPTWSFWPASDSRLVGADRLAALLVRTTIKKMPELAPIAIAIQKSATRLTSHRARLIEVFGDRPWIVPDVSHLLPDGPVDVPISDRFVGVGINHLCRQEWTTLTWLCFLAGSGGVSLPTTINPPVNFVPIQLVGFARYFMAFDAEPAERVAGMLAESDCVSDENRAEVVDRTVEIAAQSDWFGVKIASAESAPDISFLHADENAFIGALRFVLDPTFDLFDEEDEEEDEDEDEDDE